MPYLTNQWQDYSLSGPDVLANQSLRQRIKRTRETAAGKKIMHYDSNGVKEWVFTVLQNTQIQNVSGETRMLIL